MADREVTGWGLRGFQLLGFDNRMTLMGREAFFFGVWALCYTAIVL